MTPLDHFPLNETFKNYCSDSKEEMKQQIARLRKAVETLGDTQLIRWMSTEGYLLPRDTNDLIKEIDNLKEQANNA